MASTSRKPKAKVSGARPKKYTKLNVRQIRSIVTKWQQKVSLRDIAKQVSKAWGFDVPWHTVRSIIDKHASGGATRQEIDAKVREAIRQGVHSLLRLRKTKRFSRLRITYGELNEYVTAGCARWGLTEEQVPSCTKMRELISEIPAARRTRDGRRIRTVFNTGITQEGLDSVNRWAARCNC